MMKDRHVHIRNFDEDKGLCPFCILDSTRIFTDNKNAVAILDCCPVSPGHTLIIPKRHIVSLFETTEDERAGLFGLMAEVRERMLGCRPPFDRIESRSAPDGFNIGINDGVAAGQSVFHLHIHLIPRYTGDCEQPRGGIRWVFPERAVYWKKL